jgi:hypothetical protein
MQFKQFLKFTGIVFMIVINDNNVYSYIIIIKDLYQ